MQLNLPRYIVEMLEKSWVRKLERKVSAWTETRPPVAHNRTEFGVPVGCQTQRNMFSEDLDMGQFTACFWEITRAYDRLLDALERQSVASFSRGRLDIAGSVDGAKACLKKPALRLYRRLRSLASKVAAKTTATTSR